MWFFMRIVVVLLVLDVGPLFLVKSCKDLLPLLLIFSLEFGYFCSMFMLGLSWVLNCVPVWYTSSESYLGLLFGINSGFVNADPTFSILTAKLTRLCFLRF